MSPCQETDRSDVKGNSTVAFTNSVGRGLGYVLGMTDRSESGSCLPWRRLFSGPRTRILQVVTIVLAALLVLVTYQKRQLRIEVVALRDTVWRYVELPHVGMVVPPFGGVTLAGDSVIVGHLRHGARQVLFVFNTRCGNCLVTLPAWQRMAEALEPHADSVHVYGLSLDPVPETRAYMEEHGLTFPVVPFLDERMQELYRIRGVPITLVTDDVGAVEYAYIGSIFGEAEVAVTDSVASAALK